MSQPQSSQPSKAIKNQKTTFKFIRPYICIKKQNRLIKYLYN